MEIVDSNLSPETSAVAYAVVPGKPFGAGRQNGMTSGLTARVFDFVLRSWRIPVAVRRRRGLSRLSLFGLRPFRGFTRPTMSQRLIGAPSAARPRMVSKETWR